MTAYQIVWQIRTPRVLLAALVGAGLATMGVAVQALVRNAPADPFILGVSSGASYAAAVGRGGALAPLRLVLTGVAMALGFQAVMSVIVYFAPDSEATATVLYWTMGSFGASTWGALPVVAAAVLLGVLVLHRSGRALDVLALGDELDEACRGTEAVGPALDHVAGHERLPPERELARQLDE